MLWMQQKTNQKEKKKRDQCISGIHTSQHAFGCQKQTTQLKKKMVKTTVVLFLKLGSTVPISVQLLNDVIKEAISFHPSSFSASLEGFTFIFSFVMSWFQNRYLQTSQPHQEEGGN